MLFELVSILAVLNATIPGQQIPIEVIPRLVDEEDGTGTSAESGQVSPSTFGIDAGIVAAVAGLAGTFIAGYKKNQSRTDATADTSINLLSSLRATDKGVADIANNIATALSQLANVSPQHAEALQNCKVIAQQNAKEWNKDLKEYYENKPLPKSEDLGLDKVKSKLKEVNHMTQPTPDVADGND